MNEQDIVNKLKSDPRALKSVMQSQDGQALLQMLSRVLSSPQGAELVQRLENRLQQ